MRGRLHRSAIHLLALVVTAPVVGQAPTPLMAQARPHLDGHLLPIEADTYAVYIVRDRDTVPTGSLVDRLLSDGHLLTRIYDQEDRVLGPQHDSIISALDDLHPVAYHSLTNHELSHLTYASGRVQGWSRLANGDSVGVDLPLPDLVYDGSSYDLVVRAADLREGFTLTVPAFLVGPNTVGSITGRVTGSASITGHDCWVFEAHFAGMPVTFWIDKRTPALRQQLMQPSVRFGILFAAPHPGRQGARVS